ncbi:hypothetical protein [Amycolatopsis echigonensis]|uniref:PE family protein n=1 Tax=Amycolatopsis echigonensis TaxID=2576905 RepID=A0A2N3WKA8_9PSEU|nr:MULTISPECIES: hypothetical protein [Amycolatopsis]MBB2500088.1 hypothetical protein [Amycolatopsis echigonensis]PKV94309.1 hypothetical protein ATK30_5185 [Amycolatopsis niigatensis]
MADNQQSSLPPVRRYGGASIETIAIAPLLGDGYSYDKATLKEIAETYESLADNFRLDQVRARIIAQTGSPGLDFSSVGNATAFQGSGRALLKSLEQCEQYCRDQAAQYRTALTKYSAAEDTHSADLHRAGGSL